MTAIITTTHERTIFGNKEGEDWFEVLEPPIVKPIEEEEVECVECSTIVPSSEAELTGTEGWGICDNCLDEDDSTSPEEDHRLKNPMECEDCGDKENPIAWEGKIKCPTCWATDEEIVFKCGECSVEIKRNSREHDNCKTENGEDWYCEDCDIPEQPIVEDGFRTNNECVCEKKPNNDYPCLCDEH